MSFAAQAQRTVITFEDGADQAGNLDGYHGISGWSQPDGLYWVNSGYSRKIDRIDFYAQSDGVAFDNFTFMTTAVPEPLTSAMLLSGLAMVGVFVKKRNHLG